MEAHQRINVVHSPNMPSMMPLVPPTDLQLIRYLCIFNQVNSEWVKEIIKFIQFSTGIRIITAVDVLGIDILEYEPSGLPGMDLERGEGYYLCKRNRKTDGCKKFDRTIKVSENSVWDGRDNVPVLDQQKTEWGRKRRLAHQVKGKKTEWRMTEYELNETDLVVLCKIYKKHDPAAAMAVPYEKLDDGPLFELCSRKGYDLSELIG